MGLALDSIGKCSILRKASVVLYTMFDIVCLGGTCFVSKISEGKEASWAYHWELGHHQNASLYHIKQERVSS